MATSSPAQLDRRSAVFAVATLGASGGASALAYAAGRRLSPKSASPTLPAPAAPTPSSATTPAANQWPDYTGAAWAQLRGRLPKNVRLTVRPVAANTSPVVLSQSPAPGTPRGEKLTLVVRGTPTPMPLPDVPDFPAPGVTMTFDDTSYAKSVQLGPTQAADGLTVPLPLASTRLSAAGWASGAPGSRATLIVEIGGRLRLRRVLTDRSAQPLSVQLAGATSVTFRVESAGASAVLGGPVVEVIE
ncbi:MAG: hypothetical protein V9G19_15085 [Tetrasphaera sp.]